MRFPIGIMTFRITRKNRTAVASHSLLQTGHFSPTEGYAYIKNYSPSKKGENDMSNLETSPVPTNGKRSIALRLCLWAGVVGPILFVLVFTIDGFLQPHYSAMSQAVSYLAVASNGWIQA